MNEIVSERKLIREMDAEEIERYTSDNYYELGVYDWCELIHTYRQLTGKELIIVK